MDNSRLLVPVVYHFDGDQYSRHLSVGKVPQYVAKGATEDSFK